MAKQSDENNDQPRIDDLISLSEAAKKCGISPNHLRLLASQGVIWSKKLGRNWFTTEVAVREYLSLGIRPGPKPKTGI
jgi:hypothetical protein